MNIDHTFLALARRDSRTLHWLNYFFALGGLIAMGLVGGNHGEQMTVEEVKNLYHEISDDIFGYWNRTKKGKIGLHSYRIKGLQTEIAKRFNKKDETSLTLEELRKNSNGCNVGVVATKMIEVEKEKQTHTTVTLLYSNDGIIRKCRFVAFSKGKHKDLPLVTARRI